MLYVFKTHGWFDVIVKLANDRMRKKPTYMEGCVSVLKLRQSESMIMFHYSKKESIFYYKEELPYIEYILNRHGIKYAIYDANTNECVQSYPAIFNPTINIALGQLETIGDVKINA